MNKIIELLLILKKICIINYKIICLFTPLMLLQALLIYLNIFTWDWKIIMNSGMIGGGILGINEIFTKNKEMKQK